MRILSFDIKYNYTVSLYFKKKKLFLTIFLIIFSWTDWKILFDSLLSVIIIIIIFSFGAFQIKSND